MNQALFKHKLPVFKGRRNFYRIHERLRKAIKIIIGVVLGAMLLAALVLIFNDTVLFSSQYNHDRECYA